MQPSTPPVRHWRVPPMVPVVKAAGAVGLLLLGLLLDDGDRVRLALAGLIAAGLLGWAAPDLLVPVRLAVDPDGIVVQRRFGGWIRLPWAAIETIDLDRRSRRGLATELVEIDAGDSLHLFGRYDVDAPLDEVVEELRAAWARHGNPPPGHDDPPPPA
ncbi:PH domain-containing protein [Micromonospora fluostatini]|uniref:PH domain-containing protein n=1 Tax=Micromonospora fluostatini TaxID=1629071 RepID=A0ABY2DIC4_9ACTN|nr:PH domain-containing protein [Micromonospora fluostatini]